GARSVAVARACPRSGPTAVWAWPDRMPVDRCGLLVVAAGSGCDAGLRAVTRTRRTPRRRPGGLPIGGRRGGAPAARRRSTVDVERAGRADLRGWARCLPDHRGPYRARAESRYGTTRLGRLRLLVAERGVAHRPRTTDREQLLGPGEDHQCAARGGRSAVLLWTASDRPGGAVPADEAARVARQIRRLPAPRVAGRRPVAACWSAAGTAVSGWDSGQRPG